VIESGGEPVMCYKFTESVFDEVMFFIDFSVGGIGDKS